MTYSKQQEIIGKQVQPLNMLPASLQINLFD